MVGSQMKNKEKGLGQRGTCLKPGCSLGTGGDSLGTVWEGRVGASLERKGKWRRWGSRTPYSLCPPLKASFKQKPMAERCGELQYGGGLEGSGLETGEPSPVMCFLPGGLGGRGIRDEERGGKKQGTGQLIL